MKLPILTTIMVIILSGCKDNTHQNQDTTLSKKEMTIENISNFSVNDLAKVQFVKSAERKIELIASTSDLNKFK